MTTGATNIRPNFLLMPLQKNIAPLLADMGINRVSITGGEPTLHPNLPEIVALIRAEGIAITLITSTSNLASVYNQIAAYVDTYMFSLDGADRSQYIKTRGIDLFDQVVAWPAKVKQRSRCQSQVVFSCVIQKANAFDLENIYDISCKSGADGISFRVPDTTSHAFGRNGVVSRPTMAAISFDPEELESIGSQLERILSRDEEIHHLNQDRAFLMSIENRLRVMTGQAPLKNNERCWAPQSSVVITADQKLKPCFFCRPVFQYIRTRSGSRGLGFQDWLIGWLRRITHIVLIAASVANLKNGRYRIKPVHNGKPRSGLIPNWPVDREKREGRGGKRSGDGWAKTARNAGYAEGCRSVGKKS